MRVAIITEWFRLHFDINPLGLLSGRRIDAEWPAPNNSFASAGFCATRDELNALLMHCPKASAQDDAVVERLLARLVPLPTQRPPIWWLPNILLDWQFAPAWLRIATLAGCAVIGFVIGITDLDRSFENLDGSFAIAEQNDTALVVFELEPPIGMWP